MAAYFCISRKQGGKSVHQKVELYHFGKLLQGEEEERGQHLS